MDSFLYKDAIPASEITHLLSRVVVDNHIGAYSIFLGQVRADEIGDKRVIAIEFTSHEPMANAKTRTIITELTEKYQTSSIHVLQSVGTINVGKICLLVLACAPHRKAAIAACNEMVERFKSEVPVWGKELFEDHSYQWKVNTK